MMRRILLIFFVIVLMLPLYVFAGSPVELRYTRQETEALWRARIQSFLDKGIIPLIDLESSLMRKHGRKYLKEIIRVMDKYGVALISFSAFQAPREHRKQRGYRWNYYIHEVVNQYPDRFILATNGGINKNWFRQKKSFIKQLQREVRSGDYPLIGEIEFRHYMSNQQCRAGRTDRDINIPLNSRNGHRLFSLSQETGVPFVIHFEPEDNLIGVLEEMLGQYPGAKVIIAHFGQVRHPERQKRFGPELVRHLLGSYSNLYYDISTGFPGRRYRCNNLIDTVIWQDRRAGSQKDSLKPEYKEILTEYSDRFVVGFDFGGGRVRGGSNTSPGHLRERIKNIRLILRDLPEDAKHNISYRNAWRLLTGRAWGS